MSSAGILICLSAALLLPARAEGAAAGPAAAAIPARTKVTAVIPPDSPPTSFRNPQTGKPTGFAVDIMDAVADRAGLSVDYLFEDSWADIIDMLKSGKADLAPGVGVSKEREKDLAFTSPIDVFPISFFVRAEHRSIEGSPGVHDVGVIRGSVAHEILKGRGDLRLRTYEWFPEGLFDLLAGRIEAFACPAPTLWQLARDSGVEARIKVVDKPIAEITRAIAVRRNGGDLLKRLDAAINGLVGTAAYREIYVRWYGRPAAFWTERRVLWAGVAAVLLVSGLMARWRYRSVVRLNRELTATTAMHRKAEMALRLSTAELDRFFDVTADLLCIADTSGQFRSLNRAWERTLGFAREELMVGKFLDFIHPDDVQSTRDAIAVLASQKEIVDFVNRYRCRDGTYRWLEWRSVPSCDLVYAAARDVTEQKLAAEKIRQNQERLESLIKLSQSRAENAQELLGFALEEAIRITKSRIGYIYFYNEEKQEFTLNTWSRDVMKECSIDQPPTVYQLAKTGIWGEAVRQRKPIVVQDFHAPDPLKKGYPEGHAPLHSFLTVPVFQLERIVAVVGVANKQTAYDQDDIRQLTLLMDAVWKMVEHKKTETALKENEAVLRSFLDAVTESVLLVDVRGRVQIANETVAKRFATTMGGIIGRSLVDLLPHGVGARRMKRVDEVFATGQPVRFEDERDGRIIDNSAYPVLDERGVVVAAAIIGADITERKLFEREREKLITDLQKAVAEIRTLHGILPICSSCKKIRDDAGAWHQMEAYIRDRTDAEFSHGLCAECAEKLYPRYVQKKA